MGKKKQVKRNESHNQEASSSSTSDQNRIHGKIIVVGDKDEPVEKKLKTETKAVTLGETEAKKSFDDLPPEMLMKILKKLDDADLFRYRIVNRQWNGVASKILQSNAGVEIHFECYNVKNEIRIKGKNQLSFKSLIKYFEDSAHFPYSRLRFDQVQLSFFKHGDWIKLIANHGERIKCLTLGLQGISENELIQVTSELRKLLLTQLLNLQQFGFKLSLDTTKSKIQLFPTTSTTQKVRLPHLKVLHLEESSFKMQSEFVTNILDTAVNLQKIELFRQRDGRHEKIYNDFLFLHSLGKLDLLKSASIVITSHLLSTVKENCKSPPEFKLKELELDGRSIYSTHFHDFRPETAVFLSNLFESSKDTLTKLTIPPLEVFSKLQLPTFSKLTNLSVYNYWGNKFLPAGLNLKESFPVLHFLDLAIPWATVYPNFDDNYCLPSLETLHVVENRMNSNSVAQINSMCPNLKNLKFKLYQGLNPNRESDNFPEVGTAIWTHLTKLHSLELYIRMNSSYNNDQAVDSCITGISKAECKRLYHLVNAEKSLELSGSQWKIPESEWKYERENVSILNLKDLKSFTVHLDARGSDKSQSNLAMTCVSENYALKLMDNLTYNIKRY